MSKSICSLYGALRLAGGPNGISLPVFTHHTDNYYYMPELDGDFRIQRFVKFVNTHGYRVDSLGYSGIRYRIGDYCPVIFRIRDDYNIIDTSLSVADTIDILNCIETKVIQKNGDEASVFEDVKVVFHKRWAGEYGGFGRSEDSDRVRVAYHDVLKAQPVRSIYWVRRFNQLASTAQKYGDAITKGDVRELFVEWIHRFVFKSDVSTLLEITEDAYSKGISDDEVRWILFIAYSQAVMTGKSAFLRNKTAIDNFTRLFDHGLYGEYVRGMQDFSGLYRIAFDVTDLVLLTRSNIASEIVRGNVEDAYLYAFYTYRMYSIPIEIEDSAGAKYREIERDLHSDLETFYGSSRTRVKGYSQSNINKSDNSLKRAAASSAIEKITRMKLLMKMMRQYDGAEFGVFDFDVIDKAIVRDLKNEISKGKVGY